MSSKLAEDGIVRRYRAGKIWRSPQQSVLD